MKLLVDISEEYYELLQKMPDDEMTGTMYAIKYAEKPCEDAISRQAAIDIIAETDITNGEEPVFTGRQVQALLKDLPSVNPQEPKTGQFAKWVATEIFDDMWEYNKDAFAEIACRKLAKLGIVRANGDKWELVEPQESEVEQ